MANTNIGTKSHFTCAKLAHFPNTPVVPSLCQSVAGWHKSANSTLQAYFITGVSKPDKSVKGMIKKESIQHGLLHIQCNR